MKTIKILFASKLFMICVALIFSSCDKYLEVEADTGKVAVENLFNDDKSATSAIYGLYQTMVAGKLTGGGENGLSVLTGLSSDELHNVLQTPEYLSYENNQLLAEDSKVQTIWVDAYRTIYQSNDILENLESSTGVTDGVKSKLKGEALFCRAFCYFYLVNLFGDVPLITSTDHKLNAKASRTLLSEVYDQIISDLEQAQTLLKATYPESERVRPNKYAATALLSRTYLYNGEWEKARIQADSVIAQADYFLEPDLNNVFTPASQEVIWQLATEQELSTPDGSAFIISQGIRQATNELTSNLLNAFENNDSRAQKWISFYHEAQTGTDFYYPHKYKVAYGVPGLEHFVVLRLAEQYLIRAEANAQLDLLSESIADLDEVRVRAGLDPIATINPGIQKEDLLDLILEERQKELFTEGAHRWFDLKRTGSAMEVLQPIKPGLSSNDLLYPIPHIEFVKNRFLGDQNTGY